VADIPDLDTTTFIFVGEVTAVGEPEPSHLGKQLQDVTYKEIQVKMGSKLKVPSTVFHDVTKSPLPAIVKVGNRLIVGVLGDHEETYVHQHDQATLKAIQDALDAFVEKLVTAYLQDHNFDLSLPLQEDQDGKAFLDGQLQSLDEIADSAWKVVRDKVGDASEGDIGNVRKYVGKYYQQKKKEAEAERLWQLTFQGGYAPAIPFWASRSQPPGYLRSWQQGQQYAVGWQNRQLGSRIHQGALTLSLFDSQSAGPIFSNALAAYQFSYARMLGNPIFSSGPAEEWTYLVFTVFGSVGLGIGNDIDDPNNWNHIHLHIMHQEQAGAQLGLNIGKWTIIAQGAVVYSGNSVFGIPVPGSGFFSNQGSTLGASAFGGIQYAY
jgi:hypothetical protein